MGRTSGFAKLKPVDAAPQAVPAVEQPLRRRATDENRQASRVGLKTVIFYEDPDVAVELKVLAARQKRTIQAMMREALNDMFLKYGLEKPTRATEE